MIWLSLPVRDHTCTVNVVSTVLATNVIISCARERGSDIIHSNAVDAILTDPLHPLLYQLGWEDWIGHSKTERTGVMCPLSD